MTLTVATALDLPADSPGGSVELFRDLYTGPEPLIPARAFMLPPHSSASSLPPGLEALPINGKCLDGPPFLTYVGTLKQALHTALAPTDVDVVHLQHLAFGATPALIRALPDQPRIALVHGTDLLFAGEHLTQHFVLAEAVHAASAITVPTPAMADRLATLVPDLDRSKIVHVPWGIPDHLLTAPPPGGDSPRSGPLRLLYAGRLTSEKGALALAQTCASVPDVELSIAAPPAEYAALAPHLHQTGCRPRYLGWLDRPKLWAAFADHDALAIPSTTLEAFGLIGIEAQACGLPVLYQPVPGLTDILGDTALPTDLTHPNALADTLSELRSDASPLADLRTSGRANAARFPLSATAKSLTELSHAIA
jgi:glycosyltransferase involved in cell wall biosynthesis